jgi:hypothetical protein
LTHFPTGDVAADTITLQAAIEHAFATGEAAIATGDWVVPKLKVDAPAQFDLVPLRGDARIIQADLNSTDNWQGMITLELGRSWGKRIECSWNFVGGGQSQVLGEQSALFRVTRNRYPAPLDGMLDSLVMTGSIDTPNSIGISVAASSKKQWLGKLELTGFMCAGPKGQGVGRGHIEWGSSVSAALIDGLIGDAETLIQTESEIEVLPQNNLITDSVAGVWQFGGKGLKQNTVMKRCQSLTRLELSAGTYEVVEGVHNFDGPTSWYRSNVDVHDADLVFADHAFINIFHTQAGLEDVQLNRRLINNHFRYSNADNEWRAAEGSKFIDIAPSGDTRLHGAFTAFNDFDERAHTCIDCLGSGLVSHRDRLAGEIGIRTGEMFGYGGDVVVHAEGDDQRKVRGVPLFVTGDVPTANMRVTTTGNGWRAGVGAGQSVIDEYASYTSTRVFNRDDPPGVIGGIKGDTWNAAGRTWRATRTSRSNAGWVEVI